MVSYEQTLCYGMLWGYKNTNSSALRPEASKFVHSYGHITASSLKDLLKSQSGCGKLSRRSTSRLLRKKILGTGDEEVATLYTMVESFLEYLGDKCEGSVTDCQV